MSDKNRSPNLSTLRAELIADIEALSDEELIREAREAGEDIEKVAAEVRSSAREAAASVLRAGLASAKSEAAARRPARAPIRPRLEDLKRLVRNALTQQPGAALAFREGKAVSDNDWQTLFDDLVALGAIRSDPHEN
jgi:hypothetical protein